MIYHLLPLGGPTTRKFNCVHVCTISPFVFGMQSFRCGLHVFQKTICTCYRNVEELYICTMTESISTFSEENAKALGMSMFNDHRRCLEILDGDDEEKRKLVQDNLKDFEMTFGKHKGKSFRHIFTSDTKYVWWATKRFSVHLRSFFLRGTVI